MILLIWVIKMVMHFLNSEMQQRSVRKEEAIYPLLLLHLYFSCNSTSLLQYTLQCTLPYCNAKCKMQNARYTAKAIHPLLLLQLYFPAILPSCTAMHNTECKRQRHLSTATAVAVLVLRLLPAILPPYCNTQCTMYLCLS